VGSEQRLLLPVTKAHTGHSHSDLRSEEEVRLLVDHHDPLRAIGYVAALLCSSVNSILNRNILSVFDFIFFSGSSCEITHKYITQNL
jgi:hypothetical protein